MSTTDHLSAGVQYDAARTYPDHGPDHAFRALTSEQWDHWRQHGWVVVPDVIPADLCDEMAAVLWDYIEADPDDRSTWYSMPAHSSARPTRKAVSGMVEMYHHPVMWKIREHQRLYDVFVDLWGTEALWVTIDRANVNLPNTDGWHFEGFLHWDIDPVAHQAARNIQASVSLADAVAGSGALQIVPQLFDRWNEMAETQRGAPNPKLPDTDGMEVVEVESTKGSLVLWDSRMVHGAAANTSDQARLAMYVSMVPAAPDRKDILDLRFASFHGRTAPAHDSMRGHPDEIDFCSAPELSPHGRRLLGLDPWPTSP